MSVATDTACSLLAYPAAPDGEIMIHLPIVYFTLYTIGIGPMLNQGMRRCQGRGQAGPQHLRESHSVNTSSRQAQLRAHASAACTPPFRHVHDACDQAQQLRPILAMALSTAQN